MTQIGLEQIASASHFLKKSLNISTGQCRTAVVLGSGLSQVAKDLQGKSIALPFADVPHMPPSTVDGHSGHFIKADIQGHETIIVSGRLHCYEGWTPSQVAFPIRLLGQIGIKNVILTNASGAIADNFVPGQLMAIRDHINLVADSPLVGRNIDEIGPRFVDMTEAYDKRFIELAKNFAREVGVVMHDGIYMGVLGPAYETPAEIRAFRTLGADAVGMSTIFETIAARHMGMKVLGICCLTNKAAGLSGYAISHQEVVENNSRLSSAMKELIEKLVVGI